MRHAFGAAFFITAAAITGCLFIDNPGPADDTGKGGAGGAPADAGNEASADADTGPSLCEKYGGYAAVEQVVAALVERLTTDCRISAFFTVLTPDKLEHVADCLTKQMAVLMKCPGIKYDVSNSGADCRDMKTSHDGLGIRADDFDAVVEDIGLALSDAGIEQTDIDAMMPALTFLKGDVVTNSAPGLSKDTCGAGGGG
jgi:truncated hemoglobin YjbI